MRSLALLLLTALLSMTGSGQAAATDLQTELHNLQAKWMKAYDSGDGVTMGQIEMDNLVLVMPAGEVWAKRSREEATSRSSIRQLSAR